MAYSCIHQLIDPWQREVVFGTRLVKVGEVDTSSPFATLLRQDHIGEPFQVMNLPNEVSSEQSIDFLVEGLALFRVHLPRLLLHRFDL